MNLCRTTAAWYKASRVARSFVVVAGMALAAAGCVGHPIADSQTGANHGISSNSAIPVVYLPCCGLRASLQNVRINYAQDYRPKMAALDATGSHVLQRMSWQVWNSIEAIGTGTADIDTCESACAGGSYVTAPVMVTLFKPQECGGKWFWLRAALHYPQKIPPGEIRNEIHTFSC